LEIRSFETLELELGFELLFKHFDFLSVCLIYIYTPFRRSELYIF
jgi:hypothetical protein